MIVITMWIHTSSNYCSMIVLLHTHAFAGNHFQTVTHRCTTQKSNVHDWELYGTKTTMHTPRTRYERTQQHTSYWHVHVVYSQYVFEVTLVTRACTGNNDRGTRSNFVKPFCFWDSKAILLLSRVTLSSVHYNRNFQNHSWFSVCDVITVSVTSSQCLWRDPDIQWKWLTIAVFNLQS